MRNFSGGAAVELIGGDTLRLILRSPTGEQAYHDLTPAEAEAIREALVPVKSSAPPATKDPEPHPSSRKKTGKEK